MPVQVCPGQRPLLASFPSVTTTPEPLSITPCKKVLTSLSAILSVCSIGYFVPYNAAISFMLACAPWILKTLSSSSDAGKFVRRYARNPAISSGWVNDAFLSPVPSICIFPVSVAKIHGMYGIKAPFCSNPMSMHQYVRRSLTYNDTNRR